jgi:hypothetical protein
VQSLGYLAWAVALYAVLDILDLPGLFRASRAQWANEWRVPGYLGRAREWLLLRRAEQATRALSETRRAVVRERFDTALEAWAAARRLKWSHHEETVVSLYRAACLRFARAFVLASEGGALAGEPAPAEVFERLERGVSARGWKAPPALEAAKRVCLAPDGVGHGAPVAGRTLDAMHATTGWLASLVDARSPEQIRAVRFVRVLVATSLVGYGVIAVATPRNRAFGHPVKSSSAAFGTAPAGAVDGDDTAPFGFHSELEESPWLRIDLGGAYRVTKVRVSGRGDCCFDQSIPLALEASSDGTTFHKIAERTEPFGQIDPWVLTGVEFDARYVRLKTQRRSVLVLSEVEVFGREVR